MKKMFLMLIGLTIVLIIFSCKNDGSEAKTEDRVKTENIASAAAPEDEKSENPLITFIELGSVNCIPCRKMQPVMDAMEKKYGDQINVIFYDVWKEDQKKYAQKYGIRLIPTQVFLDKDGNEIFRHEGFFPEQEIDDFLAGQGLAATDRD